MAGSQHQQFNVKPFDGNGYSNWEFRIKLLLEQANVLEVLSSNPPEEPTELATFNKSDIKARNIIVQCLSDNVLEMVKTKTSARQIMEALQGTYVKKGISTQVQLQRKLRSLKYNEGNSLNVFLTEFEQTVCELKAAGGVIQDNEVISQLLSAMPETFQAVTTAIDIMFCQEESRVTLDFVKNKLLMEEARQAKNTEKTDNVAFAGYRNKKWVKKPTGNASTSGSFPFKCHNCGEIGHKRYQCPKLKKKSDERQANVTEGESSDGQGQENEVTFLTASSCEGVVCQSKLDMKEIRFVVDSGATHHLLKANQQDDVSNERKINHNVGVAKKGQKISAIKEGDLYLVNDTGRRITIKNVWVCEELTENLLSVRILEELGYEVIFKNTKVYIKKGNDVLLEGKRFGNLYFVVLKVLPMYCNANLVKDDQLMHRKMGHSSKYPAPELCEVCLKGKQTRLPFNIIKEDKKAKRILEVISTDVCGPINPPTHDGKRYFVTFIDHFSHFCICYLLTRKNEVLEKFQEYVKSAEAKFNTKIERIRCDNGGEYSSQAFKDFCKKKGIKCQYTVARNPEQNGVAERFNRTIMEKARCLIFDSNLEKEFWGEAVRVAVYLTNRTETSVLPEKKLPAEIWYNQKQNLDKIKLFGCAAYNLIPKEDRNSKLDSRSEKLIMVGYSDNGYRLWNENDRKIVHGRNVIFNERTNTENIVIIENSQRERLNKEKEKDENTPRKNETENTKKKESDEEENMNRRSSRRSQLPRYLEDYDMNEVDEVNLVAALSAGNLPSEVPQSFDEAVADKGWKQAIQQELDSLHENNTWELVQCPTNEKIIDSKWVFREKEVSGEVVKKARLVARGFKQCTLNEDVYAPVARMVTIRVLLSLYVQHDLYVQQLDVKSAFLYGTLEKPVYMYQPQGLTGNQHDLVCKLNKSLYGLKQAPKCWNSLFHKCLLTLDFQRSRKDPCLYFKNETYLLMYVDDLILFSKDLNDLDHIKAVLSKNFKMTCFENKRLTFLGLEIEKFQDELRISQTELIKKVLSKFKMNECKSHEIPIQSKLKMSTKSVNNETKNFPYRELIGCLMYIMLGSRPDLSFCVSYFSQFQNSYCDEHWNHLKHVLRYLKLTENYCLKFTKCNNSDVNLVSYVDADFANDPIDRKSTTGFIIKLNNNVIYWKSKKQNIVSLSSAESEYIALSSCITENLFLAQMLIEILNKNVYPVTVFEDNQSCIKMASTLESKRTKHIDVRHHFVRDCINEGKVTLKYISTDQQQADMLTKPLAKTKFKYFRELINVVKPSE